MTTSSSNHRNLNDSARCQHRTIKGKRCRLRLIDSRTGLCFRHASQAIRSAADTNLRTALVGDLTQFEESHHVNQFLSRLLMLLAEDRVSPRRAAVMAYTCNLILRTLTVNIQELRHFGDDEPAVPRIDFGDLPRPDRSIPPRSEAQPSAEPASPSAANPCIVNRNLH